MANPVDFPGSNLQLNPPKGQEHRVSSVVAYNNGVYTVLKLQFSDEELERIKTDGHVWLSLWAGKSIPPFFAHADPAVVREVCVEYGPLWKETE